MEALPFLVEPGHSLEALASREHDLKVEYIQVRIPVRMTPSRGLSRPQLEQLVSRTAETLERTLALAGFAEAVQELGLHEASSIEQRFEEARRLAKDIVGIDPLETLEEVRRWTQSHPGAQSGSADWSSAVAALLSAVRSVLSAVPIHEVVAMAALVGKEKDGHRSRIAYDALRAFLRRADPAIKASTRAAGRAYAQGRLTLEEVATLLDLTPPDAIALLEEQGFHRQLETIKLTDEERRRRLARLRQDRLARGGAPAVAPSRVDREVIATQRIEEVDARPWISP